MGTIIISGGKIGTQIELSPEQLLDFYTWKSGYDCYGINQIYLIHNI